MNITRFFRLSIFGVERYLKSYNIQDLYGCGKTSKHHRVLAEKLGLTGFTNYESTKNDKIHVRKKSNLYNVYAINHSRGMKWYWLVFCLRVKAFPMNVCFYIDIDPETMEVKGIKCDKNLYSIVTNKRRSLASFLNEYNQVL